MLQPFLLGLARRPFVWGHEDCCLLIADWWQVNHGVDPAQHLRGTYSSEDECRAVLEREGGVLRLVARLARQVGARRSLEPQPGHFGVTRHRGGHVGAICAPGGKWAGKSPNGVLVFTPEKIVTAWEI